MAREKIWPDKFFLHFNDNNYDGANKNNIKRQSPQENKGATGEKTTGNQRIDNVKESL